MLINQINVLLCYGIGTVIVMLLLRQLILVLIKNYWNGGGNSMELKVSKRVH